MGHNPHPVLCAGGHEHWSYEMVVLNRIYTRTGDDGTTALGSGERRRKYDLRIAAYGTVDETNAAIGVVRLHLGEARELDSMLGRIQNDLFDLGADLAVPSARARPSACGCWRARSSGWSATSMP
jgi:cob(I)alamin adenosyltransferase